jgi:hypothetical protein
MFECGVGNVRRHWRDDYSSTEGEPLMDEGIEVHFDAKHGALYLACSEKSFARLRDVVVEEAGVSEIIGEFARAEVRDIAVHKIRSAAKPTQLGDSFALIGCALVGFAVLFVIVVGVATIVGWFR